MAVSTYAELKSALSDMLADTALDTYRDTFIDMAEAYFNRTLRNTAMEETATLTTDSSGLATLPTGYLAIRSVRYSGSPYVELKPLSKGAENRLSPYDTAGDPLYYSITSAANVQKIRVTPIKSSASLVVTYFEKVPALDDTTTTNWLLDLAPDAYFYRSLAEAYTWRQQFDVASGFAAHAKQICDDITSLDERARYGNAEIILEGVNP